MSLQNLVFDQAAGGAVTIDTPDGDKVVVASFRSGPVAIHDSYGFPAATRQSVTHVTSGLAFREHMTAEGAQSLADDLVAGIEAETWELNWTDPVDMPTDEREALVDLLDAHPDDYIGSIEVTTTTVVADTTEVWICPSDPQYPSYNDLTDNTGVVTIDVVAGEYTCYAYDPVTTDWGAAAGTTIVDFEEAEAETVDVATAAPHTIPCKP